MFFSPKERARNKVCVVVPTKKKKKERGVMWRFFPYRVVFFVSRFYPTREQQQQKKGLSPSFLFVSLPLPLPPPTKKRDTHMFRVYRVSTI